MIEYIHLIFLTLMHFILSLVVLEVFLKYQNRVKNRILFWVTRKSLLVVYGTLVVSLYFFMNIIFPCYLNMTKSNVILLWLFAMLFYFLKYFFPRQKFLVKREEIVE